eukprot:CCRYP_014355-RA/>CCRYP_014355-RA protein AED:0.42 eAED:0.42 QI:0/-1/0/1/-1/1/1/0/216
MKNSQTGQAINHTQSSIEQFSPGDSLDQQQSQQQQTQHKCVSNRSDSIENPEKQQGGIEQWPRQVSSATHKVVSISPYSHLYTYQIDEDKCFKSYSSSEQNHFQAQALYNAFRIRELIQSCPYTGGTAICYLMERKLIESEELLGIESLIVGGRKVSKERLAHSRFVLNMQRDLRNKKDLNMEQKLADVATARSLNSVERARLRASLAVESSKIQG